RWILRPCGERLAGVWDRLAGSTELCGFRLQPENQCRRPLPPKGGSHTNLMKPSVAARLDRLPATRTHKHATIIAGIGSLFDIFRAGVLGTVLTQQLNLNRFWLPAAIASAFVGMFIGATLLGGLADRVGRRTAFLLNLAIYSAFTFIGAFSVNASMLIASRFLAGIGIGA